MLLWIIKFAVKHVNQEVSIYMNFEIDAAKVAQWFDILSSKLIAVNE